ncbi:unnamed protein product [Bursaphelenchus xylophilus]|uniref:(pine wood nematode) hypothetical protein n=1 Tax=Bursaphelenchus xylophilus TaxID=6326 RepID=A0A7I8WQT0_BURXY|nr:unnamed protein product [Bursaphelenchus xylophilus]CAG9097138.1 unnamed protein product [Bursaphelenchus xylophilus]
MVSADYLESIVRELLPIPMPCRSLINRSSFLQMGFDSLLLASFEARIHREFGWKYGALDLSMTILDVITIINNGDNNGSIKQNERKCGYNPESSTKMGNH